MNPHNYLVILDATRHGETESNLIPGYMGGREPEMCMTKRGIEQIHDLANRYASAGILPDLIYTSSIPRTIECGRILAEDLHINENSIHSTSDLDEIDLGNWAGKFRSEVLIGETPTEIQRLGRDFNGHKGESHNDVTKRAQHFLKYCVDLSEERPFTNPLHIVAFTHFTTIKCLLNAIGAGGHSSPDARAYNGRTVRICFHRNTRQWELHGFNITDLGLNE